LRNTDWVLGFVVYCGHDTKIMMNSTGAKFKMSRIDQLTNKQIVLVFCMQIMLCLVAATFATILQLNVVRKYNYLGI
jgi:magnesium-transporting ATPase (P-type)